MAFLPPGVQSGNLAGFPQTAYERAPILEWQANTPFLKEGCDPKPMAKRTGRTNQFYGQVPYGPSTTKLTEGIPGPSLSLQQVTSQTFMDEYGDWIGISNVAESMFISNIVVDATRNLGYRGALTANLVAITAFNATATAYANSRIDLLDNEYMQSNTIRRAESSLVNANVPGRDEGLYTTFISALVSYDLFSDNSAGSATDVIKRNPEGMRMLEMGIVKNYQVLEWAGCRIVRTSTVPTYANYPSSGKTGYGTFVIGREAMLASELVDQKAPRDPNYKVWVNYLKNPTLDNPMLQTAAIISYDFFLGVVGRPNTNNDPGFRRIRCEASVV